LHGRAVKAQGECGVGWGRSVFSPLTFALNLLNPMLSIVAMISACLGGAYTGWWLARRGVTAENALKRYQRQVYWGGSVLLGLVAFAVVVFRVGEREAGLPDFLLLYSAAYFLPAILLLCCFCLGFIVLLERPGWRDPRRLQPLLLFVAVSGIGLAFLIYQALPITPLIRSPQILEGVVLQTTPYSCSAAAIATLDRRIHPSRQTTELEVAQLAGTTRQGTNTLGEIRAMEALGLAPQFQRNLTLQDSIERQQMAVLHVMESVGGTHIVHAIALLDIDVDREMVTIANPLYGKQMKTFKEMKGYWLGEAIFVTVSPNS